MSSPELVIIAALTEKKRVIGFENRLPWYLPEDLKRFKKLTIGHPVLMGRKTFESIIRRNKKPLPERRNIVLSQKKKVLSFEGVEVYSSMESALEAVNTENRVAIIGGESLYKKGLKLAHRLELTIIETEYRGDAFFPDYSMLIGQTFKLANLERGNNYRFETYKRLI